MLCEKIGTVIVCTSIVRSFLAIGRLCIDQEEAKVGQYAVSEMHKYKAQYPNAIHDKDV